MSSFNLFNKVKVTTPHASPDFYYGPYTSIAEAKAQVPSGIREIGRTVGIVIVEDGVSKVKEYWWESNTSDEGLVLKEVEIGDQVLIFENSLT